VTWPYQPPCEQWSYPEIGTEDDPEWVAWWQDLVDAWHLVRWPIAVVLTTVWLIWYHG
jgi:hypothetical protein